jgi:hypothetical protein
MEEEQQQSYVKKENPAVVEAKIEEMRNKLAGKMSKWANAIHVSQYVPDKIERKEGEIWRDRNGKKWEMKGGVPQSISTLQDARMPFWCPDCSKPMNHRLDRKFYYLRGWCFDCNIEWEGKMRVEGTWEAFERRMVRENEKAFLRDKIDEVLCYIRDFTEPQMHFEDGRWEKLATKAQFQQQFDMLLADVEIMENRLDAILKEEQEELANETP